MDREVLLRAAEETQEDKIQTRDVYRTGPSSLSGMPSNVTAEDVIRYEQEELENEDIQVVTNQDLKKIPARNLDWVTFNQKDAQQYVNLEEPK